MLQNGNRYRLYQEFIFVDFIDVETPANHLQTDKGQRLYVQFVSDSPEFTHRYNPQK